MYESYNYGFYKVRLYFDAVHDLKYFYVFVTEPEAYRLRKSKRKLIAYFNPKIFINDKYLRTESKKNKLYLPGSLRFSAGIVRVPQYSEK